MICSKLCNLFGQIWVSLGALGTCPHSPHFNGSSPQKACRLTWQEVIWERTGGRAAGQRVPALHTKDIGFLPETVTIQVPEGPKGWI